MIATVGTVAPILSETLGHPESNVRFYAQAMRDASEHEPDAASVALPRGKRGRGAAPLTTTGAVSWTIGLIEAESVSTLIGTIRKVRSAKRRPETNETLARRDAAVLDGLMIGAAHNAGQALDALVDDMRSGRFETWCAGCEPILNVEFVDRGEQVIVTLGRLGRTKGLSAVATAMSDSTILTFARKASETPALQRIHRVDRRLFEALAKALGPPPS